MRSINTFSSLLLLCQSLAASVSFNPEHYGPGNVIQRDVVVVGGGSAGIYSGIRLHDQKKSVAVIERKGVIGGHAETYTDPITGIKLNLGVVVFGNTSTVTDYFSRLNVGLTPLTGGGGPTSYVDFSTGSFIKDFSPSSPQLFGAALAKYSAQLDKYPSIQKGFNMTYPVPEDLLITFGDFVKKYGLGDFVQEIFIYNQGYAPLLNLTNLYMLKYLNAGQVKEFETAYLTTTSHNTHQLYDSAAKVLGSNILYNATIVAMDRSGSKGTVKVVVKTPNGHKLVLAKKLVCTAPPTVQNLHGFDLSSEEKALFGQFFANGYYSAVIKNSGLAPNASLNAIAPGQQYDIPKLPGLYSASRVPGTDLTQVFYGSPTVLSNDRVQSDILAALHRLKGVDSKHAKIVAFTNHSPFNLMVSAEAIKKGFYKRLLALQGQRNTFFAGAAWQSQDSSAIWEQIENAIVPPLLAQL